MRFTTSRQDKRVHSLYPHAIDQSIGLCLDKMQHAKRRWTWKPYRSAWFRVAASEVSTSTVRKVKRNKNKNVLRFLHGGGGSGRAGNLFVLSLGML